MASGKHSPQTSSRLFLQARQGSRSALDAIFARYGDRLHALIRLRLGPRLRRHLESRDIVQETMLKAFAGIDRFEGAGSRSMMAWLAAIAGAEIRDQAKFYGRKKRSGGQPATLDERVHGIAEEVRTEVSRLQRQADFVRLERALEALSEAYREVILLRHFEDLSFGEIGERLGKSPDACRMLLSRATAALALGMRRLALEEA